MFLWLLFVVSIVVLVFLVARIASIRKSNRRLDGKRRKNAAKTLIVLGSGGHTTEMLKIIKILSFDDYSPRIYVLAKTDKISASKISEIEMKNAVDSRLVEITRSREVGQSYVASVFTTLAAFYDSLNIVWREKPDLIVTNGPGTCVPICLAGFIGNLTFFTDTKIVFVESFCRMMVSHSIITADELPWDVLDNYLRKDAPMEMKIGLTKIYDGLRKFCETNESMTINFIDDSLIRLEACLDQTWEALNTGYWKNVSIKYRHCYTLCSAMKCILSEIKCEIIETTEEIVKREKLIEIIKQIDKAILLGAPIANATDMMTQMACQLNKYLAQTVEETLKPEEISLNESEIAENLLPGSIVIPRVLKPSMETFYRDFFKPKSPVILEGCLSHWKALTSWKDINYLMKIAGNRTVPIEIGSRYTEEDWSQSLVTFADFLRTHVSKKSDKVGYLAQHQLFEQIPELKDDFAVPEYCIFSDTEEDATAPDINAWFGPRGTVSPLHYDPKNNLLCQVFGCKRVILYNPNDSDYLYPYETRLLSNTSQIDPLNTDFVKWPKFVNAKPLSCYLRDGEILFIPPGWWHHVESLTPSFSISFWWS